MSVPVYLKSVFFCSGGILERASATCLNQTYKHFIECLFTSLHCFTRICGADERSSTRRTFAYILHAGRGSVTPIGRPPLKVLAELREVELVGRPKCGMQDKRFWSVILSRSSKSLSSLSLLNLFIYRMFCYATQLNKPQFMRLLHLDLYIWSSGANSNVDILKRFQMKVSQVESNPNRMDLNNKFLPSEKRTLHFAPAQSGHPNPLAEPNEGHEPRRLLYPGI